MSDVVRGNTRRIHEGALVASGSTATRILGPYDLVAYPHKSFTLWNQGAVTLSGAIIRINPDPQGNEPNSTISNMTGTASLPNEGMWENYDTTSFADLGSGVIKTVHISTATARWWDVVAVNNQPPTLLVSGYCYANAF